jgi:glycosyltransferase involved in cell wall biosynthesis
MLTVIIKTHNNEAALKRLLTQLSFQEINQVVVADNGSHDATIAIARQFGTDLARLNNEKDYELWKSGLQLAYTPIVWFLNPNTIIPHDAPSRIIDIMEDDKSLLGGYFNITTTDCSIRKRILSHIIPNAFSHNILHETGLFVRSDTAIKLGGIPNSPSPIKSLYQKINKHGNTQKINQTLQLCV